MLPTYAFYLALMAVLSSPVMAAPMDTLSSIQCHCLTFYTYSAPATCALPHSQNLSWDAAQSFASANKLDITFASQMSISRVLEVERPLPTSVLMTLYGGLSRGRSGRSEVGSRVVCGSWDEVTKKYVSGVKDMEAVRPTARPSRIRTKTRARKCDGLISEIVGFFVVFMVLYAALEFVWSRFSPRPGQIQLAGHEKDLLAFTTTTTTAESGSAPLEFDEKHPDHDCEAATPTSTTATAAQS